ncbi:MAG: LLM class F420-dependent oxidoreductase [Alphaproteobacteria bacterium]
MQFGAFFPTQDMPADRVAIRDWAQAVEDLGYDYIQVPDHVLGADRAALPDYEGPYDIDDTFHEVFVTLGFLAAVTERVGLSTGVLILPQRQTALVAKQAAQIDILCGGRFRLGVGVGWNPVEYEALGQDWKTRGRRQTEQVQLMNRYWTERTVDFAGEFDRVHHAGISPPSLQQPIPVWFGGGADGILKRAAKYGAGWIPLGNPGSKARARLETLHGYLREEGRDPAAFGLEAWVRSGIGGPEDWRGTVETWRGMGASHITFNTSTGQESEALDGQIEAMGAFMAAMQ